MPAHKSNDTFPTQRSGSEAKKDKHSSSGSNGQGELPESAFSEPSEPGDLKVAQSGKPKAQTSGNMEENPQVIAHKPGQQAADKKQKSKL